VGNGQNSVPSGLPADEVMLLTPAKTAGTGPVEPSSKLFVAELCSPVSVVAVFAGVAGWEWFALRVAPAATSAPVAIAAASFRCCPGEFRRACFVMGKPLR
jgi:hypothetical protein